MPDAWIIDFAGRFVNLIIALVPKVFSASAKIWSQSTHFYPNLESLFYVSILGPILIVFPFIFKQRFSFAIGTVIKFYVFPSYFFFLFNTWSYLSIFIFQMLIFYGSLLINSLAVLYISSIIPALPISHIFFQ